MDGAPEKLDAFKSLGEIVKELNQKPGRKFRFADHCFTIVKLLIHYRLTTIVQDGRALYFSGRIQTPER